MTGTVITKKGIQLLVKVLASETMLKFTRIEVGTGGLPAGYDPANMVRLNRYKMDAVIAKCKADGDVAKITMQLGSQGIESGFIMSEIGIYAEDPDVGDILYAYLDLQDDPQYIYAEGGQAQKFLMFTLEVAIEEAAKVVTYINPEGLITRAEFERELRDVKEELARENEKTRKEFEELKNSAGTAQEYDPDSELSYCVGDYRMHQGILYKCIKDTSGEWDEECWERTDALGEINGLKSSLKDLKELFMSMFSSLTEPVNITIPASGWSNAAPFANRVAVAGVSAKDNVDITFIPAQGATNAQNIAAWEGYVNINYSVTEDGAIVFYALEEKPGVNIAVAVKGMVRR